MESWNGDQRTRKERALMVENGEDNGWRGKGESFDSEMMEQG